MLAAKDSVVKSIVQALCPTLGPSFSNLAGNFHARRNKSLIDAFRIGSGDAQLHAYTAIDGINFHSREMFRQKEVSHLLKSRAFLIQGVTARSPSCRFYFRFRPLSINSDFCFSFFFLALRLFFRLAW